MKRFFLAFFVLLLLPAGAAQAIDAEKLATEPAVYAKVTKEPNPLLLGCYERMRPSEFKRPNSYEYCLVKKGDKYAVYYYWKHGKTKAVTEGWMPFTIVGDMMISDTEPSRYLVEDGNVYHNYGDRASKHKMRKVD